jgi:peptidoglycan/LPS O-acetylase OafA/YrhL
MLAVAGGVILGLIGFFALLAYGRAILACALALCGAVVALCEVALLGRITYLHLDFVLAALVGAFATVAVLHNSRRRSGQTTSADEENAPPRKLIGRDPRTGSLHGLHLRTEARRK